MLLYSFIIITFNTNYSYIHYNWKINNELYDYPDSKICRDQCSRYRYEVSVVAQWHYYDIDRSPSFLIVQCWFWLEIALIDGFDLMILNTKIISAYHVGRLIPEYLCSHQYYLQFQSIHQLHDCVPGRLFPSFPIPQSSFAFMLDCHFLPAWEGKLRKVRKWV